MGLVVGFGSKNVENYDPIASTVGLDPSNNFSYGLSGVGTLEARAPTVSWRMSSWGDHLTKNEGWRIAQ